VEIKGPKVDLKPKTPEQKQELEDRVNELVDKCQINPDDNVLEIDLSAVTELLMIAEGMGYDARWVYHRVSVDMRTVNYPLLHAIAKVKGYKPGWAYYQGKELAK